MNFQRQVYKDKGFSGMKNRPTYFNFMMVLLVLIPLGFFLQIVWLYGHNPVTETASILKKLTFFNYVTMGVLIVGAPLYARGSRLLLIWMPISFFVVGLNNWFVSKYGHDFQIWQTFAATGLYFSTCLITIKTKYLQLILNPSLRWWRCSKRWPITVPVKLKTQEGETIQGQTFDVSKTGAFIKTKGQSIKQGQKVYLEIITDSGPFMIEAKIIRTSAPQGHYPAGIGVQFSKLDLCGRLLLQKLTQPSLSPSFEA